MKRIGALQPGRYYHVYNRGNNRENVFIEQRNYSYFLKLYAHYVLPVADTFAYCLLPNHFHLFIRLKTESELSASTEMSDFSKKSDICNAPTGAFAALFTAYTKAINKACNRTGRLFQEHFGRIEVTADQYFTNLIYYIHHNPQKHGFVQDFRDWQWSSYGAMLSNAPTNLCRKAVMDWFGDSQWFDKSHRYVANTQMIHPLIVDDLD
jgi:putative transposase